MKNYYFNVKLKKSVSYIATVSVLIIIVGYLLPEKHVLPVEGSSNWDWKSAAFWERRGTSVHKGIDIFVKRKGIHAISSTNGIVIYNGKLSLGGNVIFILGPRWKIYYYAHLERSFVVLGEIVNVSEKIGLVGNTGNAVNTPAHLHFEIMTLIPFIWRWDDSPQSWKKMFYLNPDEVLSNK